MERLLDTPALALVVLHRWQVFQESMGSLEASPEKRPSCKIKSKERGQGSLRYLFVCFSFYQPRLLPDSGTGDFLGLELEPGHMENLKVWDMAKVRFKFIKFFQTVPRTSWFVRWSPFVRRDRQLEQSKGCWEGWLGTFGLLTIASEWYHDPAVDVVESVFTFKIRKFEAVLKTPLWKYWNDP